MNRREFLKRTLAAGISTIIPFSQNVHAEDYHFDLYGDYYGPITYEQYEEMKSNSSRLSLDDIISGGSESRQALIAKLSNGATMMRHATNLKPNLIRAHAETRAQYNINQGDINEIDKTIENLENLGLLDYLYSVSNDLAVDSDFYLSKISTESVADPFALSKAGAIGIAQVLPGTYQEMRDGTNGTMRRLKDNVPEDVLESLKERPLRDLLLITPEVAENIGIPLERESRYFSDLNLHLNVWLPYTITAMKHFDSFPGTGLPVYEALTRARTGLEVGALTALNFWLHTHSPVKNANIEYHNFDPGQAMADPAFPLVPQAPSSAYIRGQNGTHGTVERLVALSNEPYTVLEGMNWFDGMNTPAGRVYSAELLRKYEYLKSNQS